MEQSVEKAPSSLLVKTKFMVPRNPGNLIERRHLIHHLEKLSSHKVVLLVAPAGFGKTTVLAQWRETRLTAGERVAWLSLDEDDADPERFLAHLVHAFLSLGLDLDKLEMLAEQGLSSITPTLAILSVAEALDNTTEKFTLILEDWHRADTPVLNALLEEFVMQMPDNLRITISSRIKPGINIPKLIASGLVSEMGSQPMRFSKTEVHEVLQALNLTDLALERLMVKTEGWPVAVQLVNFLIHEEASQLEAINQFKGHSGHIANYLISEVINKADPDTRDFLIRTSIFERFNLALANAVLEAENGQPTLVKLDKLEALLVPLDTNSSWYRYHNLFAECLREQLSLTYDRGQISILHDRASHWFEAEGMTQEAVRHAGLASNFERCARLIEEAGGWELILFGGIGFLRGLLKNIPAGILNDFPRLMLAKAYLAVKDGDLSLARGLLDSVRSETEHMPSLPVNEPGLGRDLLNVSALVNAYEDQHASIADYQQYMDQVSATDGLSYGILYCAQSLAQIAQGKFEDSLERSREAVKSMRMANTILGLNYCYLHIGVSAFYLGDFKRAKASFWQAGELAKDNFGSDSGLKYMAEMLQHAVSLWSAETVSAQDVDQFLKVLNYVRQYDGWLDLYAVALETLLRLAQSFPSIVPMKTILQDFEQLADNRNITKLKDMVQCCSMILADQNHGLHDAADIQRLERQYPLDVWRQNPHLWRPYLLAAEALAIHYFEADRPRAFKYITDAIECAQAFKVMPVLASGLVYRAFMYERTGQRDAAQQDLRAAASYAAPETILRPFVRDARFLSSVRSAYKLSLSMSDDIQVSGFLRLCIHTLESTKSELDPCEFGFSSRESEVFYELLQGGSNKEIARNLDLTEHTVKFHLKNIYKKLGVNNRAEAVEKTSSGQ